MKTIMSALFVCLSYFSFAQQVEEKLSKIYYSDSDTIKYKYSAYPDTFKLAIGKVDTTSPGTDVSKGIIMTAFIGKDTLRINGDNFPYGRRTYVIIQTPRKKTVVIFRYNAVSASFSQHYIDENEGKISYEIPEVYELANIIWTLSPSGKTATDLQKNTDYYKRVEKYFSPYLDHPVFKKLQFQKNEIANQYYEFRENSFIYKFEGNRIVNGGVHNYVFGSDWDGFTNLFTDLLPLVKDFAVQSNFRKFYVANKKFYNDDLRRVEELLPVRSMWNWLEKEFPARHNAYKIIFSPLIGGSHSTQKYYGMNEKTNKWFSETVMFICDANRYDIRKELSETAKKGLMSGIVFTEIDHNYVNPISSKYSKEISEIYNSEIWTNEKNSFYNNPMSVFNEYMTHAAFCVWARDSFDQKTSEFVIEERVKMNRERRGFIMFDKFTNALLKLKQDNPTKLLSQLYPEIISWSRGQLESRVK